MKATVASVLSFLARDREWADAVAATVGSPVDRGDRLAHTLHALWPTPLSACALYDQTSASIQVLDGEGKPRPDWYESLHKACREWALDGSPAQPAAVRLAGQSIGAARIAYRDRRYGFLAAAWPRRTGSAGGEATRVLLDHTGAELGLLLYLESVSATQASGPTEQSPQAWLEDFADLTYIVLHEFNNDLNNMLLQVAVLDYKLAGEANAELASIKQIGNSAAIMVRQLQQLSQKQHASLQAVDLNAAVGAAAEAATASGFKVELELAPRLPPVRATPADLRRLLRLLLQNAAAATAPEQGRVRVQTEQTSRHIRLIVQDTGPPVAEQLLPRLFEPFAAVRAGADSWDLAVCKAIVRRLQGSIQGENQPAGGVAFLIDLQAADKSL
jgi:signal transduction histidine kinase